MFCFVLILIKLFISIDKSQKKDIRSDLKKRREADNSTSLVILDIPFFFKTSCPNLLFKLFFFFQVLCSITVEYFIGFFVHFYKKNQTYICAPTYISTGLEREKIDNSH